MNWIKLNDDWYNLEQVSEIITGETGEDFEVWIRGATQAYFKFATAKKRTLFLKRIECKLNQTNVLGFTTRQLTYSYIFITVVTILLLLMVIYTNPS